jgi:hypothetical protein
MERSFGIKIDQSAVNLLADGRAKAKITAGDLHSWIASLCRAQEVPLPPSSWNRVRLGLALVVGKSPNLIRPNTLIVQDLGFS